MKAFTFGPAGFNGLQDLSLFSRPLCVLSAILVGCLTWVGIIALIVVVARCTFTA